MAAIKNRVLVKRGTEMRIVKYEDIACFFTENKTVFLVTRQNEKFLVGKCLKELEEELNPTVFFRANRKFIINIDQVKKIRQVEGSYLEIEMFICEERILISPENASGFKSWLETI